MSADISTPHSPERPPICSLTCMHLVCFCLVVRNFAEKQLVGLPTSVDFPSMESSGSIEKQYPYRAFSSWRRIALCLCDQSYPVSLHHTKRCGFYVLPIQRRALLYFEIWSPWISWTCLRLSCCPPQKDNRSRGCPATDHNTSPEARRFLLEMYCVLCRILFSLVVLV
jgi:hypothetical protein